MTRIGLISDTHGLLRPEALAFLHGCDRIVHGGDIGGPEILEALAALAPVTAVRGNNDRDAWAQALPEQARLDVDGTSILVVHDLATLAARLPGRPDVVVSGHSHRPLVREKNGVLYVNPGSAGRRRFRLPITLGELVIDAGRAVPRIVELDA